MTFTEWWEALVQDIQANKQAHFDNQEAWEAAEAIAKMGKNLIPDGMYTALSKERDMKQECKKLGDFFVEDHYLPQVQSTSSLVFSYLYYIHFLRAAQVDTEVKKKGWLEIPSFSDLVKSNFVPEQKQFPKDAAELFKRMNNYVRANFETVIQEYPCFADLVDEQNNLKPFVLGTPCPVFVKAGQGLEAAAVVEEKEIPAPVGIPVEPAVADKKNQIKELINSLKEKLKISYQEFKAKQSGFWLDILFSSSYLKKTVAYLATTIVKNIMPNSILLVLEVDQLENEQANLLEDLENQDELEKVEKVDKILEFLNKAQEKIKVVEEAMNNKITKLMDDFRLKAEQLKESLLVVPVKAADLPLPNSNPAAAVEENNKPAQVPQQNQNAFFKWLDSLDNKKKQETATAKKKSLFSGLLDKRSTSSSEKKKVDEAPTGKGKSFFSSVFKKPSQATPPPPPPPPSPSPKT